jgi:hypothetical protein
MEIKFFKKEKNLVKGKRSLWMDINLYWRLAILLLFAMAVSSAFFGYYFFKKVNAEIVPEEGGEGSQIKTIKRERIEKVLEYFSMRKERSNEILNSPSPLIDPSL